MQKVITINLNGNAYQLDETAFSLLRAYLDEAEVQLKNNPDRAEILADLEQAIADKCQRFLGPHKTVIQSGEIEQVVKEMGPVDGGSHGGGASTDNSAGEPHKPRQDKGADGTGTPSGTRKRLYQIPDGAMLSGVCNGLAAYFNIDVTIVRLIFVVLAIVTKGVGILVYLLMAFVIPRATTSEEHAEAHGLPFNAQELIDQARKNYSEFKDGKHWRQQWRQQQRQWRQQHRQWRAQWRETSRRQRWNWWTPPPLPRPNVAYGAQVWTGLMVPVFSLVGAAFFIALVVSVVSLVRTGGLFGWPLPVGMPLWTGILVLVMLYHVLVAPIRSARHASLYAYGPGHYGWVTLWDGMVWLGLLGLLGWLLVTHMPEVHNVREFIDNVPDALRNLGGF